HCAEALYVRGRNEAGDTCALEGAALIAATLPGVVAAPRDIEARRALLRGASLAGEALALAGLGLAHAMAQALGGTYGLPHGAMNALCLPPGVRFAEEQAPEAVARFRRALSARSIEELAALGDFGRLRAFGVAAAELP